MLKKFREYASLNLPKKTKLMKPDNANGNKAFLELHFQYFKVGSLSQFISSSSSSSSRSSLNVFWKVFAEVGYKWLGNLTDCKGGSQDNKAHSHMMMLIIMLTIAMFVMIHHVQAENSNSNHLVPTTWQGTSGVLAIATMNMLCCRKIMMLMRLIWTARKGWKFI